MPKKKFSLYIWISLMLTMLPVGIYIIFFRNQAVALKTSTWSDFATFFSGWASPVFAFLNLIVLIRLTLTISETDNQRMVTQFRYEAFKELATQLNSVNKDNYTADRVVALYHFLTNYGTNNYFLLSGDELKIFNLLHVKLWLQTSKIKKGSEQIIKLSEVKGNSNEINQLMEDINTSLVFYDIDKFFFLTFMRKTITGESIAKERKQILQDQSQPMSHNITAT